MTSKTLKHPITLTPEEIPLSALLSSAGRAVIEAERSLGLQTIKAPFLSILWLIHTDPGHAQGEYAAALHYDLATFGRHVEALVADGYLHKSQADYDHRVMELRLTPAGEVKIAEKTKIVERMDAQVEEALGREDMMRLKGLLARYLDIYGRFGAAH